MKRILIVDDHNEIREVLRKILEEEGYEVNDAPDVKTAIALNQKFNAEILITDICMPEKSGLEIIEELSASHPDLRIVAISGGPSLDDESARDNVYGRLLKDALERGAHATLSKPFERAELLNTLTGLFAEKN